MEQDVPLFINRDLSWLSFNERVLMEASRPYVPLLERLKFLAIYSSNLDEFYRVRMPLLMAFRKLNKKNGLVIDNLHDGNVLKDAKRTIGKQQETFGRLLCEGILPGLLQENIHVCYNTPIPAELMDHAEPYFHHTIAAHLEITHLDGRRSFFPKNNQLYLAVMFTGQIDIAIVNIPSEAIPRFFSKDIDGVQYVAFIDDIIKLLIDRLFDGNLSISGAYSFKVTRDADIQLDDEYGDDMAEIIEAQISKRDYGLATRMLYEPGMPKSVLDTLISSFSIRKSNKISGGNYHNLKDFFDFPAKKTALQYLKQIPIPYTLVRGTTLFDEVAKRDLFINTPYESYDTVLRFFNEAAIAPDVKAIKTTMYRVAQQSRIIHALISAAKNGKSVTVFVELKARFDEANNIKWAKRMKEAGINILYSIPGLKVHAKVALVTRDTDENPLLGLLSTGNFNENTANVYTDHMLLTAHQPMLEELDTLFSFLQKRKRRTVDDHTAFGHLLVASFNMMDEFMQLINGEICHSRKGLPARITIKMNNIEEEALIKKLYEASQDGVEINLIIRGICRIRPGVKGLSDNISVRRIVGRYLEHGRIFIFHNNGKEDIYMGSADWMNRNIYRRIEVCFPVYDPQIKQLIKNLVDLQLRDDAAAVVLDENCCNVSVRNNEDLHSQQAIYGLLATNRTSHLSAV
ncbi:polyphosphate kinase 1 [Parapedobacter tibetensis]|uniref:polyphosphate kinase 1 n=1 Tax=Parapedobacter tibetensis TaxID=2972951 RepID=UPI00214D45F9|nr:polyphosphate kinase 1 [Parapedobacter tibetensis]